MLLTGSEIKRQVDLGKIIIEPWNDKNLSTNSYDITLSNHLLIYDLEKTPYLDMHAKNPTKEIVIPDDGIILEPGILYLGASIETATSYEYVPMFEGRSSIGRLGIYTHVTAGFGDIGWGFIQEDGVLKCTYPTWTLEIQVIHPIKIYAGERIGQVYFFKPIGEVKYYSGKYHCQKKPTASRIWQEQGK